MLNVNLGISLLEKLNCNNNLVELNEFTIKIAHTAVDRPLHRHARIRRELYKQQVREADRLQSNSNQQFRSGEKELLRRLVDQPQAAECQALLGDNERQR